MTRQPILPRKAKVIIPPRSALQISDMVNRFLWAEINGKIKGYKYGIYFLVAKQANQFKSTNTYLPSPPRLIKITEKATCIKGVGPSIS